MDTGLQKTKQANKKTVEPLELRTQVGDQKYFWNKHQALRNPSGIILNDAEIQV